MIYLDNSASTLIKPKEVIKAVENSLLNFTANPGRSGHKESIKSAYEILKVREKVQNLVNTERPENVIFTLNCSEALNLAILGSAKKGHIVCTENEHNSVLRPLQKLKDDGVIEFSVARQKNKKGITRDDIERLIKDNTYMVICNHISNVNGDIADIENIGKLCQEKKLLFLVDGAQSGGHLKIDMIKNNISMLTLSPHKGFYSPQGIGCLIIRNNIKLNPIKFGGTGTNSTELYQPQESPERYECGTLNTPAILGFGAGIDFVKENQNLINEKIDDLTTYFHYELSKLPTKIYTHIDNNFGVVAFNIAEFHSSEIANFLDEKWNICVRSGYHCAPEKHKALKTINQGCVRVSISYFNNFTDIEKTVSAIKSFCKKNLK